MRHFPLVWRWAMGAAILVLVGMVWLAWPTRIMAQPPIPHQVQGREDCLSCHATGEPGVPQMPEEDHDWHTSNSCQKCHDPLARYAPYIPHALVGFETCTACHVSESEAAAQAAGPVGPVPTPVAFPSLEGEVDTCRDCHLAEGGSSEQIVLDWESSVHAEQGVICASCHGGDPNAADMDAAKSPETGYIGRPDRTDIPELCGSCHADVNLMRQYNLPTDQLAKYRESVHGLRLAEGDTQVATCFDCHDGHASHEPNDPRASVYRLNVPELCAGCHADETYMAAYDIPTDQYALYRESVHGIALIDNQDIRAPSCATCHGTHGAAPPGFAEVANVCGSCHDATQNYYVRSAHNSDDPEAPRCVTCHGRYDVQESSETMFLGDEPRHCGSCHAPDSEVGGVVTALYQSLVDADAALAQARSTVARAANLGMIVTDEEGLLNEVYTRLTIAQAAQHSVNLETVRAESNAAIELSGQARQQAEDAIAENLSRRQAMVIALAVIGLIIFSLVLLRRQLIAGKREEE